MKIRANISAAAAILAAAVSVQVAAETPLPPPIDSRQIDLSKTLTRIAIGSCFAPQLEDHRIWNSVAATKPDLFLYLGDNVYQSEEIPDTDLPHLKEAYNLLGASEPFQALRKDVSVMVTWDDHDYGMNDAGASWVARLQAETLHEHVWEHGPGDARKSRPGVYYAKTFGAAGKRVQVIMLDTRYFRSDLTLAEDRKRYGKFAPTNDTSKTMLGEAQWRWLEAELKKEADLRLIVSSVALVQDDHTMEGWRTLPHERRRLYDLIANTGAKGVVVLAGDRHFSGFYRETQGVPYPITEFMSSSMNLPITGAATERFKNEAEPRKLGASYMPANFGVIEIDWKARRLSLQVLDAGGEKQRDMVVELDQLQP